MGQVLHGCARTTAVVRRAIQHSQKSLNDLAEQYAINPIFVPEPSGVQTEEGKLYMFVAVDRTSKFAFAELHPRATRMIARGFLDNLAKAVPYKIHTILTGNGIQFAKREGTEAYWTIPFDRLCDALGIEHRLTKINHPWTNGQVERMNRTIKDATVKRYHYQSHGHLKQHLHTFLMAYNFAKRLKALKGLTSYQYICKIWTKEPDRFNVNPFHYNVGLNT